MKRRSRASKLHTLESSEILDPLPPPAGTTRRSPDPCTLATGVEEIHGSAPPDFSATARNRSTTSAIGTSSSARASRAARRRPRLGRTGVACRAATAFQKGDLLPLRRYLSSSGDGARVKPPSQRGPITPKGWLFFTTCSEFLPRPLTCRQRT